MRYSFLIFILSFLAFCPARAEETALNSNPTGDGQQKARLLYSAMLAGDWLVNNQNKETLWGSEYFNGDYGRWIYEYNTKNDFWRGSVCWTMATGIMDLIALYERTGRATYKEAIDRAAIYLKSLQILDCRTTRNFGAFREMSQVDEYIFPRDGMTAMGGFLALYSHTGDKEYLERAGLYAEWYLKNAINPETGWPYWSFPFNTTKLDDSNKKMGHFQGGGGLFLYYLYKLTGNRKYLDEGVKLLADNLLKYYVDKDGAWKITGNNDDFGTITLLAAYRELGDKRYWDAALKRLELLISLQREDGALVPGNTGGCFISMITALDMLELAREKGLKIDRERIETFISRCSDFTLTLQETDPGKGVKAYGGFYGQLDLQDFRREWIHARATTYSVIFNLRCEGKIKVPFYSIYGWD